MAAEPEGEADFLGRAPRPEIGVDFLALAQGARGDAAPSTATAMTVFSSPAPQPAPKTSKLSSILAGVHPQERTPSQQWALAAHMRSRKAELAQKRKLEEFREAAAESLDIMNSLVMRGHLRWC
jgi:hypothetical protein